MQEKQTREGGKDVSSTNDAQQASMWGLPVMDNAWFAVMGLTCSYFCKENDKDAWYFFLQHI